ncbi:putative long-chain-alcohol O-fatty-acyltransferase 5 [Apium graveolens]|uniref:putative long-chain-alcohol O-fatty-acyltransferase 5 n=1 Tax=Apium graveolens TaxID=4045 RepID=UPI003D7A60D4
MNKGRMEDEVRNFIVIWLSAFACLFYCNVVSVFVRKGMPRLMAMLPVILLFFIAPLHCLHTCHMGVATVFCLSWIANFKLLLLSFDTGPLSDLSLPPLHFLALACLPIIKASSAQKPPPQNPDNEKPQNGRNGQHEVVKGITRVAVKCTSNGLNSPLHFARRTLVLPLIPLIYAYKESIHPVVRVHIYSYYVYVIIEFLMVTYAMLTQWLLNLDLQQPFNDPYLSTSLREFWGRRWNLVSTNILRLTIFNPMFHYLSKTLGQTWALSLSILGTFLVSALMHELLYFQIFRVLPTWSFINFFVVQGLCLVIEGRLQTKFATVRRGFPPPFVFFFVISSFAGLVMVDLVNHNVDTIFLNQYAALLRVYQSWFRMIISLAC